MPNQNQAEGVQVQDTAKEPRAPKFKVEYTKSQLFRIISATGFMAGITSSGAIHLAAWNEHAPYPTGAILQSTPEGIDERSEPLTAHFVREIEVGLDISPDIAEGLIELLKDNLEAMRRMTNAKQPADETSK